MRNATFSFGRSAQFILLAVFANSAAAAEASFKPPRTSWGHPVIQGVYNNYTNVPVERPRELGDKAFYTEEEYAARSVEPPPVETAPGTIADVHYEDADFGLLAHQNDMVKNLRTSLITQPANGRLPPLHADAQQRSNAVRASQPRGGSYDSAQARPVLERCIIWPHEGPPLRPVAYNSTVKIMQTQHHVILMTEMIHDARVVPISQSRPDFKGLTRWQGNAWGRWEGDTLVIETTGITDRVTPRGSNLPLGPEGKVIEKITRTGPKTIRYEFTVSDPSLWDVAWGGEFPMEFTDDPVFEYACHEGNYGIANILSGAREDEKRAPEAQ
jgi:hypothetical protein